MATFEASDSLDPENKPESDDNLGTIHLSTDVRLEQASTGTCGNHSSLLKSPNNPNGPVLGLLQWNSLGYLFQF
jgi:hypothetical protein